MAKKEEPVVEQIVTEMAFSKSTKGTHVFVDAKDDAAITTLYIKRSGFQGDPPKSVSVTVKAND